MDTGIDTIGLVFVVQVAHWETWGKNAQAQFQQQLQQQLAALNHQLSEKHRAELLMAQQAPADEVSHPQTDVGFTAISPLLRRHVICWRVFAVMVQHINLIYKYCLCYGSTKYTRSGVVEKKLRKLARATTGIVANGKASCCK